MGIFANVAGLPFAYISYCHVAPRLYGFLFCAGVIDIMATNQINRAFVPRVGSERCCVAGRFMPLSQGSRATARRALWLGRDGRIARDDDRLYLGGGVHRREFDRARVELVSRLVRYSLGTCWSRALWHRNARRGNGRLVRRWYTVAARLGRCARLGREFLEHSRAAP